MAKPYGKNIDLHKKDNIRPSNSQISPRELYRIQMDNQKNVKNNTRYNNQKSANRLPRAEGQTTTQYNASSNTSPAYNDSFGTFLIRNCIAQTKSKIRPGTHTSIDVANPTGHLGNYLLRKGDAFYIYNRKTFQCIRLVCDADQTDAATSITITSTVFTVNDSFISGSYIIPDFRLITERVSNAPEFKRFDLTNSAYRSLNTSPLTLVAGQSGTLIIPLNVTILFNHGGTGHDEMTAADMYVGLYAPSIGTAQYWASIDRFAFRSRDPLLYQLSPGIYGAGSSTNFQYIAQKTRLTPIGKDLKLYTTANFTSTGNTITVLIYYKQITI
tara:strand:- start:8069 stop:9052 length:984 start_codon:yes stop_codon:yes gene_type:complete